MTDSIHKKVTLKTISQKLGVSPATISKALRESTDISEEMKRKVRAITAELGYQPNLLARSLVQKRSNIIGVIIPDLNISYYADLVQYIYESAQVSGYESIVMFHHEDPEKEQKNLQFLVSLQVDGILISPTIGNRNSEILDRIQKQGTPVIYYDRKYENVHLNVVTIDDRVATEALIEAFLNKGRRRIGYIGAVKGEDVTVLRFNSYKNVLKKLGIKYNPQLVIECQPNGCDAQKKMQHVLSKGIKMDALLCAGGFIAYYAGKAILAAGLKMPEDIILGEFGHNSIVQRLAVSYFIIDQSPELIGSEAVKLLDNFMNDKKKKWESKSLFVRSKLIYYDHYNHNEEVVKIVE